MKVLQSLLIGTTMAATTLATGTIAASPAQAMGLNGSFTLTGTAVFEHPNEASPLETSLNFEPTHQVQNPGPHMGDFFGLNADNISFETLNMNRVGSPLTVPGNTLSFYEFTPSANPFINFGNQSLGGQSSQLLTFNLDDGLAQRNFFGEESINTINLTEVTGTFFYGGQSIGKGSFGASRSGATEGYSLSLRTEPVPEPLTILGTGLALGFGVMFKKKGSANLK
ncbi:MAG: PEP-CTERM sorting domain-containing protein [Microcoleaceae cyanobacterium]